MSISAIDNKQVSINQSLLETNTTTLITRGDDKLEESTNDKNLLKIDLDLETVNLNDDKFQKQFEIDTCYSIEPFNNQSQVIVVNQTNQKDEQGNYITKVQRREYPSLKLLQERALIKTFKNQTIISKCNRFMGLQHTITQRNDLTFDKQGYLMYIDFYRIDGFFEGEGPILTIEGKGDDFNLKRINSYLHCDNNLHIWLDKDQSLSKTHMFTTVINLKINLEERTPQNPESIDLAMIYNDIKQKIDVTSPVGTDQIISLPDSQCVAFVNSTDFKQFGLSVIAGSEAIKYMPFDHLNYVYLIINKRQTVILNPDDFTKVKTISQPLKFIQNTKMAYDMDLNFFQIDNNLGITHLAQLRLPPNQDFLRVGKISNNIIYVLAFNQSDKNKGDQNMYMFDRFTFKLINKTPMQFKLKVKSAILLQTTDNYILYTMLNVLYQCKPYYNHPLSQGRTKIFNDELDFQELIFDHKAVCLNKNNPNLVEIYDLLTQQVVHKFALKKAGAVKYLSNIKTLCYIMTVDKSNFLISQNDTSIQISVPELKEQLNLAKVVSYTDDKIKVLIGTATQLFLMEVNNDMGYKIEQIHKKTETKSLDKIISHNNNHYFLYANMRTINIFDYQTMTHRKEPTNQKKFFFHMAVNEDLSKLFCLTSEDLLYIYDWETLKEIETPMKKMVKPNIKSMRIHGEFLIFQLNTMDMHIFKLEGDSYSQGIFIKFEENAKEYKHLMDQNTQLPLYGYNSDDGMFEPFEFVGNNYGDYRYNLNDVASVLYHVPNADKIEYINYEGKVKYYHDVNSQMIGQLDVNFRTDQLIQIRDCKNWTDNQLMELINSSFDSCLKYYPNMGNLVNKIALRPVMLDNLIKRVQVTHQDELPILVLQSRPNVQNPFDESIEANQIKSINLILQILVRFQNNHCFNYIIGKHLKTLIDKSFDLNDYFESELPIVKINDPKFTDMHQDSSEIYAGVSSIGHPRQILDYYDQIFDNSIEKKSEEKDVIQSPIEYFLVNLPECLAEDPKSLMESIASSQRIEIFENLTIQSIIIYKWSNYTQMYFQRKLLIFLIFIAGFVFEAYYSLENIEREDDTVKDNRLIGVIISTKIICSLVLLYFIIDEVKQLIKSGKEYFQEWWNIFDMLLFITYFSEMICEAFTVNSDVIVVMKVTIMFLAFLKVNFFLRIYDGFSFLVTMMSGVFSDLKYFLAFFTIFIFQFGITFMILFHQRPISEYSGIQGLTYYLMAFRTSSGDFNVDDYSNQGNLVIISWMIWIVAVLVLNIIFMNFIIAVISESYEKVMQKSTAESFRVKAKMIVEREMEFSESDLFNQSLFPKYILLRRAVESIEGDKGEWQGFIKDLKLTVRSSAMRTKSEIVSSINSFQGKMQDSLQKVNNLEVLQQDFQRKFDSHQRDVQEQLNQIKSLLVKSLAK
ncbi:wd-40 repeat protein [Stylonychia lemnae]|uniref:Wd-40 repeat protein n=1 Tax=Stylonychia lemnae TaxID=5949 RepID=A0A078AC37_STYLE|nr:wd-40 repeat protein [Stylonychia lemnae]|eukprot:CDW79774.1 wd-40 repeat protein [Stylonychia lemnae]